MTLTGPGGCGKSRLGLQVALEPLGQFEDGTLDGCAECLEGLAIVANARRDSRRAAQLFGLATVVRREAGTALAMHQLAEVERELDITRSRLDQATFDMPRSFEPVCRSRRARDPKRCG